MPITTAKNTFLQRLIGAAALDTAIYEEVEADESATSQAFLVVLLSSLAAGIGVRGYGATSIAGIFAISAVALLLWASWALLTFEIGARLMPRPETRSNVGELLRTIGFAATPGLLRVLGVLPGITTSVFLVSGVWMLASMIVAVRQSLDYQNTGRAIAVCVFGWLLAVMFAVGIGLFLTPAAS